VAISAFSAMQLPRAPCACITRARRRSHTPRVYMHAFSYSYGSSSYYEYYSGPGARRCAAAGPGRQALQILRSAPPHSVTVREYCPSTCRCTITAPPAAETPGIESGAPAVFAIMPRGQPRERGKPTSPKRQQPWTPADLALLQEQTEGKSLDGTKAWKVLVAEHFPTRGFRQVQQQAVEKGWQVASQRTAQGPGWNGAQQPALRPDPHRLAHCCVAGLRHASCSH
jgi:hypothetical protein